MNISITNMSPDSIEWGAKNTLSPADKFAIAFAVYRDRSYEAFVAQGTAEASYAQNVAAAELGSFALHLVEAA